MDQSEKTSMDICSGGALRLKSSGLTGVHRIVSSQNCSSELDLHLRPPRMGPERDLVQRFLSQWNIDIPKGSRVTLFEEPKLESGFPDLVAVVWNQKVMAKMHEGHKHLKIQDVRVQHYLYLVGRSTIEDLVMIYGPTVHRSIERLHETKILKISKHSVQVNKLPELYAVTNIVAIEAKVSEWKMALDQAVRNLWFASDSFVLLPYIPRGSKVLELATGLNIGVRWPGSPPISLVASKESSLPISYASWLFNLWCWRAEYFSIYEGKND